MTAAAGPLAAERWREWCLASVTTHDLPPTAGYLAGDHVRLRDSLGLLTRPVEEELAVDAVERQAWLGELRRVGLLSADGADVEGTVAGAARLPGPDAVAPALRRAHRRGGRPAYAEPARHHRRVPQLAGAAQRPGRPADAARGRVHQ